MKRFKLSNILIIIVLTIVSIFILFPIGVLIDTSTQISMVQSGEKVEEQTFIANYARVIQDRRLPRFFINSIIISVLVTVGTLLISSMAGFAFSKLKMKFSRIILNIILMGLMVPTGVILVPLFLLFAELGLISNYASAILIFTGLFMPFGILVLRNFMDNISSSFLDAGKIDGCNDWQLYYKIMLPLTRPALVAVGIFSFLWSWNDYLIPLIFLRKTEMQTVQLAPQFYLSFYHTDIPLYFASMVIIVIPVIIVYAIFQNNFIEGLTGGGLKE